MPEFTIILPVKNGSKYVHACIESILAQTHEDFNLAILENCSTDDTLAIINSFNDKRITVYPAAKPLSMEDNWHRAVAIPKKEFMTLIGHDDLLDRDYLKVIDRLIKERPEASLYQAHFRYIDSKAMVIGRCTPMKQIYDPVDLVHGFFYNKIDLMGTGFVMRSSDYEKIGGIPMYPGLLFADMELFIKIGVKSYLAVAPNECFSYRKHAASTTASSANAKYIEAFKCLVDYLIGLKQNPELTQVIERDSTELLRRYCQAITHRSLRTAKKLRSYSVDEIINLFRGFAKDLGNETFDPLDYKLIRLGKVIDNTSILRVFFALFKKIVRKPLQI